MTSRTIGHRSRWMRRGFVTASLCAVARHIRAEEEPGTTWTAVGCLLLVVMLIGGAVAFL